MHIILAVYWVGGGDDAAAGVERSVDARFCDRDSLLFHDFVDRHTVNIAHLVKFVDTDNATVGQNHGTGLEAPFTRVFVRSHSGCETDAGAAAAGGSNGEWCGVEDETEHLRFGGTGVTDHEHVDVATDVCSIRKVLLRTTKKQKQDGKLDLVVAVDRRGKRLSEKTDDAALFREEIALDNVV